MKIQTFRNTQVAFHILTFGSLRNQHRKRGVIATRIEKKKKEKREKTRKEKEIKEKKEEK